MSQISSTRVLVGLTSCIALMSFVAYSQVDSEEKVGKKKSEKDGSVAKKNSKAKQLDVANDVDEEIASACKPMFDYCDDELSRRIAEMA